MSENTAKITDPIWDSRNSDEPEAPTPAPETLEQKTMMVQKLIEERDAAIVRAERAEALLDYALECWGRQVNALRTAYEAARKRKL